jgi:hypothetical protein
LPPDSALLEKTAIAPELSTAGSAKRGAGYRKRAAVFLKSALNFQKGELGF